MVLIAQDAMHDFAASLLEQERVAAQWMGHSGMRAARDHALCELIDTLHAQEQRHWQTWMPEQRANRQKDWILQHQHLNQRIGTRKYLQKI